MRSVERRQYSSAFLNVEHSSETKGPICPLTGSTNTILLETLSTSLLIDCYQRDLALDVTSEFQGVKNLQLWRCLDSDLMFFHPPMTGSEEFYREIQNFDWYFPEEKFEYDQAGKWIQADHHILDIGCGAGQFFQKTHPASYTGLAPHALPTHDEKRVGTCILSDSIAGHAMKNIEGYDVVCAFQVLEHIANPKEFLTEALACLKPGGLLILGVPSAESYVTKITNFVLNAPPHHVTWWTDKALQHLTEHFQLSLLKLMHAPVESWETRLYWMQRLANIFSPMRKTHFTTLLRHRLSNIAAYIAAGLIWPFATPSISARGSTVVMVAQKKEGSSC